MKNLLFLGLALIVPATLSGIAHAEVVSAAERPAIESAKASRSLLVDIAYAGKRLVAVGERGHVLFSDDQAKTWRQSKVPVSVMLTAVYFANAQEGWAVGHNGVILFSSDAGESWVVQRSDKNADDERAGSPLLDVWFADNQNGFVVGAYGYFLATNDGGLTWSDKSSAINNPEGLHLNAISGVRDGIAVVAGERGVLWRSFDNG
ncbi:MAG: YCF48-related protein, partial [Moraxellaceae bacterium]|nr:YCF48-related protein [Moraxellaceae bacterium]